MTILTLAQQKVLPLRFQINLGRISDWFEEVNSKGFITFLCLGVIGISVISYLIALYATFGVGFKSPESSLELSKLKEEVISLELGVREKELVLAQGGASVLQSMEKISAIKYVTSGGPATSEAVTSANLQP